MIFFALDISSLALSLEHWEWAEYISCALVALGCAGEYIAEFTDYWTGGIQDRKVRLSKRSTLLLISALALELLCLVKTSTISGTLIGSLSDKAGAADTDAQSAIEKASLAGSKANDAALKSGDAQNKADSAANQADALTARMESASTKMGGLEHDIFLQSPRWSLVAKIAPQLAKQLTVFSGQRVDLFVCGRFGSQDGETLSTWGAIANILENDGAKWSVAHGGLEYFDGCSPSGGQPLGQGLMVFVSKTASKVTMDAAKTLSDGLTKALPPSPNKMPGIIDPDLSQRFSQPIEGKDTPWAMVANDSSLITVLVGAHPQ
jgi:hypothetical protein